MLGSGCPHLIAGETESPTGKQAQQGRGATSCAHLILTSGNNTWLEMANVQGRQENSQVALLSVWEAFT